MREVVHLCILIAIFPVTGWASCAVVWDDVPFDPELYMPEYSQSSPAPFCRSLLVFLEVEL